MNKTVLAILIIIGLILLGAPLATGMVAETQLERRIEAMNENPWIDAEIVSYERSWLTSRARIELGLSDAYVDLMRDASDGSPAIDLLSTPLPVVIDLEHGPVAIGDSVHIGMARVTARPDAEAPAIAALQQNLGIPYLFEFRGRAGFGNRFDFDADVPPIDYAGPFGDWLFSGLEIVGSGTPRLLDIAAHADQFEFQSPLAGAVVDSLSFEAEYELRPGLYPLGSATFGLGQVTVSSLLVGGEPIFELTSMSLGSSIALDAAGERLSATNSYSASSIRTGDGLALTDVELGLGLLDLSAGAVSDYYTMTKDAVSNGPIEMDTFLESLQPVIDELVTAGLRVTADPIRFSTESGTFDGRVVVEIDGSGLPPGPIDVRNIAVLLGVLSANADLSVGKPLARDLAVLAMRAQIAAAAAQEGTATTPDEITALAEAQAGFMLVGLVGQGMLVDDGENYTIAIDFDNAEITVNGNPLPVGLF